MYTECACRTEGYIGVVHQQATCTCIPVIVPVLVYIRQLWLFKVFFLLILAALAFQLISIYMQGQSCLTGYRPELRASAALDSSLHA